MLTRVGLLASWKNSVKTIHFSLCEAVCRENHSRISECVFAYGYDFVTRQPHRWTCTGFGTGVITSSSNLTPLFPELDTSLSIANHPCLVKALAAKKYAAIFRNGYCWIIRKAAIGSTIFVNVLFPSDSMVVDSTWHEIRSLIDSTCSAINNVAQALEITNSIFEDDRLERATLEMLEQLAEKNT